ncbi:MAG TPA: pantetheine-phosphate adenylyltransferase, partial [Longimicrobiaceae bacterium]|nr:pantetheine-phosphate adenylyltransferase [Longimicrobiaceae bacterium]
RALCFADRVVVAIAHRATQSKRGLFSVPERLEILRAVFADEPRVEAVEFDGLLVDFADRVGATLVVRGLRGAADFEYEAQMARMNRALRPALETVFLAAAPERSFVSASLVREVASLGGDVSGFVSPVVMRRIRERGSGAV